VDNGSCLDPLCYQNCRIVASDQFEHITAQVRAFKADDQTVISGDTKKKELVGNFTNKGTDYHPEGQPRRGA
jgi:hypothetical protein